MNDESRVAFLTALNRVQGTMGPVKKDSTNPFFKSQYASLTAVNESIMGPLSENGFVIMQGGADIGGKPYLRTTLYHIAGHSESFDYPLVVNDSDPQHLASATSYARRYALCALLNLNTEDDDAEAATQPQRKDVARSEPGKTNSIASAPNGGLLPTEGSGVVKFIPSKVVYVEGKGKGAGKKFSEIFKEGQEKPFSGLEIHGEIAEASIAGKRRLILHFERNGQFLNIKRDGVKLEAPAESQEIMEDAPF